MAESRGLLEGSAELKPIALYYPTCGKGQYITNQCRLQPMFVPTELFVFPWVRMVSLIIFLHALDVFLSKLSQNQLFGVSPSLTSVWNFSVLQYRMLHKGELLPTMDNH